MRPFIKRALQKSDSLKPNQVRNLLNLASSEIDRLEVVLDSLTRGILVCDTAHKLILANRTARRLLSISSYEHAGENIWSVIPEELVAEFLAMTLLAADKAEEREFDVELNGTMRLLSVSVMPLVKARRVAGSLILVDDITERRSREARMRQMENLASLSTLAAGVAHEIKNPLASLSIHVQLIQKTINSKHAASNEDKYKPDEQSRLIDKYLSVLNEEIERLNNIVVDFLFAIRPMNMQLRRGSINSFITELAEFVSMELKAAGITLILNLSEKLPALDFDAALMKQVFLNLVNNAAAAMKNGGTLTINSEEADDGVRIIVSDTGEGISDENFTKIFEPFFTTKPNGSGLGLTAVFKIVREHRGEISVESREGEGTVFTINLPAPEPDRRLLTFNEMGGS